VDVALTAGDLQVSAMHSADGLSADQVLIESLTGLGEFLEAGRDSQAAAGEELAVRDDVGFQPSDQSADGIFPPAKHVAAGACVHVAWWSQMESSTFS
jgi:hypothetical protein